MMMKSQKLSKNEKVVLEVVKKSTGPIKAYTILSDVKKNGLKAPPQVYRALDKLIKKGKIHRIESKNAYLDCQNSKCKTSSKTAFSICQRCEKVTEILNTKLSKFLSSFKDDAGEEYLEYNLEFYGICKKCKS